MLRAESEFRDVLEIEFQFLVLRQIVSDHGQLTNVLLDRLDSSAKFCDALMLLGGEISVRLGSMWEVVLLFSDEVRPEERLVTHDCFEFSVSAFQSSSEFCDTAVDRPSHFLSRFSELHTCGKGE
jgi:hypothetical protein